jgi:iron complex outermembrane receptor protein
MLQPTLRASFVLIGACSLALAQSPVEPVKLAPIAVTGTRLARPLLDSPISFTVVSRADLEASGLARLGEYLRELPEFGGNAVTDLIAFNESRGVSGFDLRGLGNGKTLILVNGRRATVNANAFDLITTYVDMNRFPTAFVERVEILKGGASAIYGADAVGGVVNILTRSQPSGGEASISYGNTFADDAAEFTVNLSTGATRGKLGISVGVDYFERNAQAHRDRSFTRTANLIPAYVASYDFYAKLPASELARFDGRSLSGPNARFSVAAGQVNGRNGVNIPGLAAGAAITELPGTGTTNVPIASATPSFSTPFRGATGGQFNAAAAASFVALEATRGDPEARSLYDFNEVIWTTPAANRIGATARVDYEMSPRIAWFAEGAGGRNRSRTESLPREFSGTVPRTNPYNPFGVDVTTAWRIPDAGPRRFLTEDDSVSALTGLRGKISATTRWETAVSYSRDEYIDTTRNVYDAARVAAAMASSNPATALNPFGGQGFRHEPALIDDLKTEAWFGGAADLLIFDAQASTQLLRLPAGPVQASAFVEYREESLDRVSDASSRANNIVGAGRSGDNAAFSRSVRAVAAELHIPLIRGGSEANPGPRVSFEAAARHEEFSSSFKSGLQPTFGLLLRPTDDLTVRLSRAATFRAPTLPQLYSPQTDTFFNTIPDPRRPAALTGDDYDGPNVARLVRQGGNPNLSEETGRAWQAGVVWSPRRLRGLTLEATWYRYDLEDLISGVGPGYVLDNELGGLSALVHRQAGTENHVNRTSTPIRVLSGPAGQTTSVAPGQNYTAPGRLSRIDIFTVNLSRRRLAGWDFAARQTAALAGGKLNGVAAVSYTDQNSSAYDRQAPLLNAAGTTNVPRWHGRASLDWARRLWTAGATLSYVARSGYHDPADYYQKPYRVVHLRASYTSPRDSWLRGTKLSLGIDDVFNETPALYPDPPIGFNYGWVARPQGRFWRVTMKRSW